MFISKMMLGASDEPLLYVSATYKAQRLRPSVSITPQRRVGRAWRSWTHGAVNSRRHVAIFHSCRSAGKGVWGFKEGVFWSSELLKTKRHVHSHTHWTVFLYCGGGDASSSSDDSSSDSDSSLLLSAGTHLKRSLRHMCRISSGHGTGGSHSLHISWHSWYGVDQS